MPNAFSPNDDQYNDTFSPFDFSYDELIDFRIYNRWGVLLYDRTQSPESWWDGSYDGEEQPAGTYIYRIQALCDDKELVQQGYILLLR